MTRKYPRLGQRAPRTQTRDHSFGSCGNCLQLIESGYPLYLVDLQVSEMRGDDAVFSLCNTCSKLNLDARKIMKHFEGGLDL